MKDKKKNKMEVEVKLRIPDLINFNRLKTLLSPSHLKTLNQKNYFFDTPTSALGRHRAVLRLRLVSSAASHLCFLTLKGNAKLVNGVSRVEEDEEEIDPVKGEKCVADPAQLGLIESRVMKRCKEEFGMMGNVGFVCLGGFEGVREVYGWRDGLKLEVDETRFGFGVCYEVECESEDPERVKGELEEFFRENGVEFKDSKMSKFAIFLSGKLPQ